jgi:hypothetical protein
MSTEIEILAWLDRMASQHAGGDIYTRTATIVRQLQASHDAISAENERLTAELKECRKEKNDLVLKAYPAMDQRDRFEPAIIAAFGLLWRDVNAGQLAIEARKALSAVLTQDEKAAGINEALGRYGDPHEGDVMAAVDRAFPPEYIREAVRADRADAAREQAEAALAETVAQLRLHIDSDIQTADSGDCGFYEARDHEPTKGSIALLARLSPAAAASPTAERNEGHE